LLEAQWPWPLVQPASWWPRQLLRMKLSQLPLLLPLQLLLHLH
jgi:hypothetical protein